MFRLSYTRTLSVDCSPEISYIEGIKVVHVSHTLSEIHVTTVDGRLLISTYADQTFADAKRDELLAEIAIYKKIQALIPELENIAENGGFILSL